MSNPWQYQGFLSILIIPYVPIFKLVNYTSLQEFLKKFQVHTSFKTNKFHKMRMKTFIYIELFVSNSCIFCYLFDEPIFFQSFEQYPVWGPQPFGGISCLLVLEHSPLCATSHACHLVLDDTWHSVEGTDRCWHERRQKWSQRRVGAWSWA